MGPILLVRLQSAILCLTQSLVKSAAWDVAQPHSLQPSWVFKLQAAHLKLLSAHWKVHRWSHGHIDLRDGNAGQATGIRPARTFMSLSQLAAFTV